MVLGTRIWSTTHVLPARVRAARGFVGSGSKQIRHNQVTGRCDRANHRRGRNTWAQSQDVNSRNRGFLLVKAGRISRSNRSNRSGEFSNSALATDSADPTDAWDGTGSRIFLRRLAHDEPSGSTQAAAKPDRGCSLAASDERAKVKSQRNGDVTSTTG
jgi:hypothetical protein